MFIFQLHGSNGHDRLQKRKKSKNLFSLESVVKGNYIKFGLAGGDARKHANAIV